MTDNISCGIDEAGRGPVIGPMIIACALFNTEGREKLAEMRVKDSKKLSKGRRERLEPMIKGIALEWHTAKISASDIDRLRKAKSLNTIEIEHTADLILSCKTRADRIVVDAADTNQARYGRRISEALNSMNPDYFIPELVCEHKADDRYIEVSAASVIAKVERDREIEGLKRIYGDFGSGYPSDPKTMEFINQKLSGDSLPEYVRHSWRTVSRRKQSTLGQF
jgi:ribonuclease HII